MQTTNRAQSEMLRIKEGRTNRSSYSCCLDMKVHVRLGATGLPVFCNHAQTKKLAWAVSTKRREAEITTYRVTSFSAQVD